MKKFCLILSFILLATFNSSVDARCHGHYHYSSTPIYVVRTDYFENEGFFPNCKDHYYITKTTVNYYSNGTKRTINNYSIFDKNESMILADCSDLKHLVFNNKHYFLVRKGNIYQIYDSKGNLKTNRNYAKMMNIEPNRILVKYDKKYGIIDLNEKIIVPIKYTSIEKINKNLYLTKLNGYWGMMDSSNKIIIPNEYDKIKRIYDTYKLKKEGLYQLANMEGQIVISDQCQSIKKLGEYILVKKDKFYEIYDSSGNKINKVCYKKIKLERNILKGKTFKNEWVTINTNTF